MPFFKKQVILGGALAILTSLLTSVGHGAKSCAQVFAHSSTAHHSFSQVVGQEVRQQVENELNSKFGVKKVHRGYAILVGAMVGSAALTTYLGTHLPPELQFTSIFIAQLSTLGVYVLGSPIWEPVASRFRQWAFGVKKSNVVDEELETSLESVWSRTQEIYSINAQMSRNNINQFLFTLKQTFYEAHRAMVEANPSYAADQVAEAAYRMRILFQDINPRDSSVRVAVKTTFTRHRDIDKAFVESVSRSLRELDTDFDQPEVLEYYEEILKSWFGSHE